MKKALEDYHVLKGEKVKAIMVGTRRDDPHGGKANMRIVDYRF